MCNVTFILFSRRVNVTHFGDADGQRWNELLTQRTYVILLQPHYGPLKSGPKNEPQNALFRGRYDDPLGAAIEFTTETERKLLKALGN